MCKAYFPEIVIGEFRIHSFRIEGGQFLILNVPCGFDNYILKKKEFFKNIVLNCKTSSVNFKIEKFSNSELEALNSHLVILKKYFSSYSEDKFDISRLSLLSGWDIRLLNLFYLIFVKMIPLIEFNIAGLSSDSILKLFDFINEELIFKKVEVSIIIVEPSLSLNQNPLFINSANIEETKRFFEESSERISFKLKID